MDYSQQRVIPFVSALHRFPPICKGIFIGQHAVSRLGLCPFGWKTQDITELGNGMPSSPLGGSRPSGIAAPGHRPRACEPGREAECHRPALSDQINVTTIWGALQRCPIGGRISWTRGQSKPMVGRLTWPPQSNHRIYRTLPLPLLAGTRRMHSQVDSGSWRDSRNIHHDRFKQD